MKKAQYIFIAIVVLVYLSILYREYLPLFNLKKPRLNDLNIQIVDMNKTLTYDTDIFKVTSFKEWGLKKSSLLESREKKLKLLSLNQVVIKTKETKLNIKNRMVCLDKKCWEFIGIVTIDGIENITLLSTDKNAKLKTLKLGEKLLDNLKVISVNNSSISLFDIKQKKKINLKLFDVNVSKYYPKMIKEGTE